MIVIGKENFSHNWRNTYQKTSDSESSPFVSTISIYGPATKRHITNLFKKAKIIGSITTELVENLRALNIEAILKTEKKPLPVMRRTFK